jgi:hypothetical protein
MGQTRSQPSLKKTKEVNLADPNSPKARPATAAGMDSLPEAVMVDGSLLHEDLGADTQLEMPAHDAADMPAPQMQCGEHINMQEPCRTAMPAVDQHAEAVVESLEDWMEQDLALPAEAPAPAVVQGARTGRLKRLSASAPTGPQQACSPARPAKMSRVVVRWVASCVTVLLYLCLSCAPHACYRSHHVDSDIDDEDEQPLQVSSQAQSVHAAGLGAWVSKATVLNIALVVWPARLGVLEFWVKKQKKH